jgi:hypothetical protein
MSSVTAEWTAIVAIDFTKEAAEVKGSRLNHRPIGRRPNN